MSMCMRIHKRKLSTNSHIIKAENILQRFFTTGTVKSWVASISLLYSAFHHDSLDSESTLRWRRVYSMHVLCILSYIMITNKSKFPVSPSLDQVWTMLDHYSHLSCSSDFLNFKTGRHWDGCICWNLLLVQLNPAMFANGKMIVKRFCKTFLQFSASLPSFRSCQ
jgi:hypothetical protein